MKLLKFFENHFGILASFGIAMGLLIGQFVDLSNIADKVIILGLFILLLVSMIKINLLEFIKDFRRAKFITVLTLNKLLVLPLIVFFLGQFLPPQYLPGMMLLAAIPAAVATPGLLILFRGDVKVGLVLAILTNLLVPFSLPLLFHYTLGSEVSFDIISMFLFLFGMVFIPFLIALVLEFFTPKFCKNVSKYAASIISIDLFIFMMVAIAPYSKELVGDPKTALFSTLIVIGLSLFFHLFAALPYLKNRDDLVVSIVVMAYSNVGLAIVIATQYFDSTTVLLTVLYEVAWCIGLIPMQRIFAKRKS